MPDIIIGGREAMQFLVYIVVLLVALGGVLVELDWLTKPKLDPKAAMQTASVAAPAPVTLAKVDGPTVELSPIYRTSAAPQGEAPAAAAAQPAEASAPPPATSIASRWTNTPQGQGVPSADAATSSSVTAETTGFGGQATSNQVATNQAAINSFAATPPQLSVASFRPAVAPQPPAGKSVALQSPNRCDVAACAGMYTSFRASDCSYQPTQGERKLCLSGSAQKAASEPRDRNAEAARKDSIKRSKEAELRAVERKVREITSRDTQRAMAQEDDADIDSALPGGRRVIIIRRGPRW